MNGPGDDGGNRGVDSTTIESCNQALQARLQGLFLRSKLQWLIANHSAFGLAIAVESCLAQT